MPLTDVAARTAKPREQPYTLADGRGLVLQVTPQGGKRWRFRYRFEGKEKMLSMGLYPDVPLATARERRDEARKLIAEGQDPSAVRRAHKAATDGAPLNSFEVLAREWFEQSKPAWKKSHSNKIIARLENDLFPWLGKLPINEIEAPVILAALKRIVSRGAVDTAHRARNDCSQVFRFAIAHGHATRDPAADLRGRHALPPVKKTHFPTILEPKAIGDLLRAIDGYRGAHVTRCALLLAPLVFVRPGELRAAEWAEFDLEAAEWRIPAYRMKAGEQHLVPLSTQALAVLGELHPLTGHGRFLFPSGRTMDRCMSENTVNGALRRLGYSKEEFTGHGFRSMASTILNEHGWHRDAIERQLAHAERNAVRAAYNYAEHLPERRRMMQAWADYLDALRAGEPRPTCKPGQ